MRCKQAEAELPISCHKDLSRASTIYLGKQRSREAGVKAMGKMTIKHLILTAGNSVRIQREAGHNQGAELTDVTKKRTRLRKKRLLCL